MNIRLGVLLPVFAVFALLALTAAPCLPASVPVTDARSAGVSLPWLVFGFSAQAAFTARFLIQWIASERAGASVVPTSFWVLSILGGAALFIYFLRRGDPVGVTGQAVGIFVYSRNLFLISRHRKQSVIGSR